jgi:uncharacterized protein YybS (DUF2232 family)
VRNIRNLTEGAILLAAFAVILLITLYIPVIGMIINLFIPAPFMLFAAKNDWKNSLVFLVAAVLISLIVGTVMSLPLTIIYGLTGVVMGMLINKKKSSLAALLTGTMIFFISTLVLYGVSVYFFKMDMMKEMIDMLRKSVNMSVKMLESGGQSAQGKKMLDQFNTAIGMIQNLIPTLFAISSFVVVLVIQLITYPILKRFGIKIENWKPFREIKLPRSLLWYLLVTITANFIFHPAEGTYWNTAFLNLTIILLFLMALQGYSFVMYFFHQRGMGKSVAIILVIVSLFLPFALYLVGILGIMDVGFDLRKRFEKKE